MNKRFFAFSQFAFGLLALIVVVVSYSKFSALLRKTFIYLASTSESAKNNSEVLKKMIGASVTASGEWLKLSNTSSDGCASEATMQAFAAIRSELPKINDMISSAALLASSVEKELPISMSSVTQHERIIKLPVYYIERDTQAIDLPFYEVKLIPSTDENRISYIKDISVNTKRLDIAFPSCKEQSKLMPDKKEKSTFEQVTDIFKCGNNTPPVDQKCAKTVIEYATKITPKKETVSLKNPDEILITKSNQPVFIEIPQISTKEHTLKVKEVKVSTNRIMEKEKKLLKLLAEQLKAMSTLPGVADGWIQLLQKELERCPAQPHAEEAKKIIAALHKSLIELQSKIKTPEQQVSTEVFKAAAEFLPCLFLILGLLSAGMATSGGAKLFVKRKKTNKGCNGPKQGCGYNNETEQMQQEPLSQNSQHIMCKQSTSVEQQQR